MPTQTTLRRAGLIFVLTAGLSAAGYAYGADAKAGGKITFDDVYAAPDDVQLNLAYARQEMKRGDLLAASGALERLLLTKPDADSVRFFYAQVLYRMDDRQGAEREFNLLSTRPLPAEYASKLEAYRKALAGGTS